MALIVLVQQRVEAVRKSKFTEVQVLTAQKQQGSVQPIFHLGEQMGDVLLLDDALRQHWAAGGAGAKATAGLEFAVKPVGSGSDFVPAQAAGSKKKINKQVHAQGD